MPLRSFVNFFVIDPSILLVATDVVATNANVFLALCGCMAHDVIVLTFIGNFPSTPSEALALRRRAMAEMVERKSKWGYIHPGNFGCIQWFSEGVTPNNEMRVVSHTKTSSARTKDEASIEGV